MFFVDVKKYSGPGWKTLYRAGTLGSALSCFYVLRERHPEKRFRIMYNYKDDHFHVPVNLTGAARRTRKEVHV